ncbi:MAG: response regulator [Lachnospiraceae bacterium]|nr:response regulator [Lachnospiraceae bacterium]
MNKIKVVIVDDEILIRKLIRMKINWEALGMNVIAEFSNAQAALAEFDEIAPDIIITDICMPGEDGIYFADQCMKRNPDVRIIILTGYDEFEYALQSIKIGVIDYVLKPVNEKNISNALLKAKNLITEENIRKAEKEDLQKQVSENLPLFRENYLVQVLYESCDPKIFARKMKYYGLNVNPDSESVQVSVIQAETKCSKCDYEDNEVIIYLKIRRIIEEFFSGDQYFYICRDNLGRIVIVCNNAVVPFQDSIELLMEIILQQVECSLSIGVGTKKDGFHKIMYSYKEAIEALSYKIVEGDNSIIYYEYLDYTREHLSIEMEGIWEKTKIFILSGLKEKACESILEMKSLYLENSNKKALKLHYLYLEILEWCIEEAADRGIGTDQICGRRGVLATGSMEKSRNYFDDIYEAVKKLSFEISKMAELKNDTIIKEAVRYMYDNISHPELNMGSVAKHLFISPGHLGRLMKKNLGKTYCEYLSNLRFEKAQRLLRETDMKAYEIGEEIGIIDPHYLSIWFKKMSGLSLNEFRKQRQDEKVNDRVSD